MKNNAGKKKEKKMVKCDKCYGSGKGQPIASGFESAGRINAWIMSQPCSKCNGTGEIEEK